MKTAGIFIKRIKMKLFEATYKEGFDYYKNRRIGKVPTETVEKILGTKLG